MPQRPDTDRVVITGMGLVASVGLDRESVWRAVRQGRSAMRRLSGIAAIPDNLLIGAPVDIPLDFPNQLKVTAIAHRAADEAIADARLDRSRIPPERFGCAISSHMGDIRLLVDQFGMGHLNPAESFPWVEQFLPNSACWQVARRHELHGPRISHSAACASGLIAILTAARAIQDHQCDLVLAGSAEAITPLFAAGFRQMRVLAQHEDPDQACRPFDAERQGFVMGEGGAMFVLERLSHAQARGAQIYAEIASGRLLASAHHLTDLDMESEALAHLISITLRSADLQPADIGYINVHGTATQQNDVAETRAIRRAMGRAADGVCASATKSVLGHLINAAGTVELAITALAMRDGFVPPTMNLTRPDPQCDLDCIPLVGREIPFVSALKLSVAFGGTLAAVALKRPDDAMAIRAPHRWAA